MNNWYKKKKTEGAKHRSRNCIEDATDVDMAVYVQLITKVKTVLWASNFYTLGIDVGREGEIGAFV